MICFSFPNNFSFGFQGAFALLAFTGGQKPLPLCIGLFACAFFAASLPAGAADNFLAALDGQPGQLPPVVDIELYGDYKQSPPDAERVLPQLEELLDRLEQADGRKPILYTTRTAYRLYLQDRLPEYQVWIRDILKKPRLEDGRNWLFWQYTGRGRLEGYVGEGKFIDLNVFGGSEDEWQNYLEICRAAG